MSVTREASFQIMASALVFAATIAWSQAFRQMFSLVYGDSPKNGTRGAILYAVVVTGLAVWAASKYGGPEESQQKEQEKTESVVLHRFHKR